MPNFALEVTYCPDNIFMRKKIFIFTVIILSFCSYGLNEQVFAQKSKNIDKQPVLVELFTSESCAACPRAEELLTRLQTSQPFEEAKLITLEFHVDYRDTFGQKDIYASPLFTQRQRIYDRKFRTGKIYTPQMVVDGDIAFIGSKQDRAEKAVKKSIKSKKADVQLSIEDERLKVNVSNLSKHGYLTVYLAIAEDGITTRNRKGENAANVSIVRRLSGLGRIEPNQSSFEMDTNFQIQEGWKKENINLVVFIQENVSRMVHGAGKISLKTTESTNEDRNL